MKKVVFAIMALAVLTSCKGLNVSCSSTNKTTIEENRQLKDFERITLLGSLDVHYAQADSFSVVVKGPAKAIKNVETEVEHNTLKVNMKNSTSIIHWSSEDMDDVTVYVTSPDFLGISLQGSGDFSCERKLDTDNLDISLRGSGDITFEDIICDRVKVSLVGSGDVDVNNIDAFFSYNGRSSDLTISFYTYTNPYTQAVKEVINKRLNDILMLEGVTCDNNILHILFGAMFFLHVSLAEANDLLLGRMKTLFERIKEDERSHQTDIYFKVVGVEYDDDVCYFECSFQSEIKRAMVVCPEKILRYDVSKGDILPELMNEVTEEDINSIADDETFELLSPQEFYRLWGNESKIQK